jgi:hypothetical protein
MEEVRGGRMEQLSRVEHIRYMEEVRGGRVE